MRVLGGAVLVIRLAIPVIAPLPDVAVHVVKAPVIGQLLTYRLRPVLRRRLEPGVTRQIPLVVGRAVLLIPAGPARVFPFRLGRQPIAAQGEVALPGVGLVARRQPVHFGALVTKFHSIDPLHILDGILRRLSPGRIFTHDLFVESLRDGVLVDVERGKGHLMRRLVGPAGAVAHGEAAGRNEHHFPARLRLKHGKRLDGRIAIGGWGRIGAAAAGDDNDQGREGQRRSQH